MSGEAILEILESAASEIRGLRQTVQSQELFIHNITIRLAINQLRHGTLDYKESDEQWDKLLPLLDSGRLSVSSSGEAVVDRKILTQDLLDNSKQPHY